ncbi:hypothetical protein BI364_00265 [Acidihalobacter yilgarnensis]|uniref:High-potential iron-sulfur protein n=1 Tax=Acidihalobacter yilgarnensis TaxID=2819280 RepID=A0A1D8ISE0_9GAMM|nr:high-potential iron-sulfur protein [Acidihalobacter yilgarnensis]AOU99430.1 hypothetical protein BI364_00265 [Acidihalobacter yilgarnensis]
MRRKSVDFNPSRRHILRGAGTLVVAVISAGLLSPPARAAKVSKAAMLYQTHPRDGAACANCVHFEPGSSPSAMGACTVVEGSISPRGYCMAYTPRA